MEALLSIAVGVALSAACGFRVFVPLLVLSLASFTGHVTLAESFAWIGSGPALISFAAATLLEVAAYYIPWLDNALDTLATPAAVVAGIVVTASVVTDISPYLRWSLAVIAGGGVAGAVQSTTVTTRTASSLGTAGMANPVVATVETGGAFLTSVLAVLWPVLALVVLVAILLLVGRRTIRSRQHVAV